MKQMEFRLRVPRPEHHDVDLEEQEQEQKKLEETVKTIQAEHPDASVEIWAEDEHCIGMQPVHRRVWVGYNTMQVAQKNWTREWSWLYVFVQPQTGDTSWWIVPTSRQRYFSRCSMILPSISRWVQKRVILPLDRAKWHIIEELKVPEGIHLFPLTPDSPELQPAERL